MLGCFIERLEVLVLTIPVNKCTMTTSLQVVNFAYMLSVCAHHHII